MKTFFISTTEQLAAVLAHIRSTMRAKSPRPEGFETAVAGTRRCPSTRRAYRPTCGCGAGRSTDNTIHYQTSTSVCRR